ncbi:Ig-like domain-containing protein, partial [Pacificimonas aurantium]
MAVDAKLVLNTNFESYTRSTPLVPDYADQTLVAITADNVVYTHADDGSSATEGTFFEVSGQNATINVQSDIAAPEILSVTGSAGVEFNVNGGVVTGDISGGVGADEFNFLDGGLVVPAASEVPGEETLISLGEGDDTAYFDLDQFELVGLPNWGPLDNPDPGYSAPALIIDGGSGPDTVRISAALAASELSVVGLRGVETLVLDPPLENSSDITFHLEAVSRLIQNSTGLQTLRFDLEDGAPDFELWDVTLDTVEVGSLNSLRLRNVDISNILGTEDRDRVAVATTSVTPTSSTIGSIDLAGGNDSFSLSNGNVAPMASGSIDGGDGFDSFSADGETIEFDIDTLVNFEYLELARGIYSGDAGAIEVESRGATLDGFTADLIYLAKDGGSANLTSTSVVGAVESRLPNSFSSATSLVNNGEVTGDVGIRGTEDEYGIYDGSGGGTVGGQVTGSAGLERFIGGAAADNFDTGGGDDELIGGGNADVLTGGEGADRFIYREAGDSTASARDTITDFATGTDRLVLGYDEVLTLDIDSTAAGTVISGTAVDDGVTFDYEILSTNLVARDDIDTLGAFSANNDRAETTADSSVTVNVLANDILPPERSGETITVEIVGISGTPQGSATVNPDNSITYTPGTGQTDDEVVTYRLVDSYGRSVEAQLTVEITPVNASPVAVDDSATVAEDGTVTIDVLANDTDADGDDLSIGSLSNVTGGSAAVVGGEVIFTPSANFYGAAGFTYTASDPDGATATGNVVIDVTAVNDAPVAVDDSATVAEDGSVTIDVLANDTDADGDDLSIGSLSNVTGGSAAVVGGEVIFTPYADFYGAAGFTYTASDPDGATASGNVVIEVTAVNDGPVAVDDSATVAEDGSVMIDVLANDTDADGDLLDIVEVFALTNGTAQIVNGEVVFTPTAGFSGAAGFSYTVEDPSGAEATGDVDVTVTAAPPPPPPPPNQAPVAENDSATV